MSSKSIIPILDRWIKSCTRKDKVARNTIAVGIVVLDHLRQSCPVDQSAVFTGGGELIGARSGLADVLTKYGIPAGFLKEVTTRQAAHDGRRLFESVSYGHFFSKLSRPDLEAALVTGINHLKQLALHWLNRQHLKLNCDRQLSPTAWIQSLLESAKGRSGGKVEQHLVGAKLAKRFPHATIENNPSHAGDVQTGRHGDFSLGSTVYHVTAAPSPNLIAKCSENLAAGLRPVLLVPRNVTDKAIHFAEAAEIDKRVMVVAIEDFVAMNIVEMAEGRDTDFMTTLKQIIDAYNQRLTEVETDLSLQIDVQ